MTTTTAKWHEADFTMDSLGDVVLHGYSDGDTWNGWECPAFSREEATRLVEASNAFGPVATYDSERDLFCFTVDGEDEEYGAISITLEDGSTRTVYAIGAGWWCWDQAE